MGDLDFFGVRPVCGCVTAWMSGDDNTPAEIEEFYLDMARTGREVRRMPLTKETRWALGDCKHISQDPSGGSDAP